MKRNSLFYKIRNWSLLLLGYTLVNQYGHTVQLVNFKQVWTNPYRKKSYSLDDKSWRVL